ncbi:MAG: hypothetical protein ACK6D4_15330 [Planctomyces sp.]
MTILEGMVFRRWTSSDETAVMDFPTHWSVVSQSPQGTAVRCTAPQDDDVWLELICMPFSVPSSLYDGEADVLALLERTLQYGPGTQILGRSSLFVYLASSACTGDGHLSWATMHMDRVVYFQTGGDPQRARYFLPVFERMLQSFRLHFSDGSEVAMLLGDVLKELAAAAPQSNPKFAGDHLDVGSLQIRVDTLALLIRRMPDQRSRLIREFVQTTVATLNSTATMAQEPWRLVRKSIFPMVRPEGILQQSVPQDVEQLSAADRVRLQMLSTPWLAGLVICYAIDSERTLRFVQHHDLERWGLDPDVVKRQALRNLAKVRGPVFSTMCVEKAQFQVAEVTDNDLPARSCWLLHPDLHQSLQRIFRGPSWVAVPSRDSLLAFSANSAMRAGLQQRLIEDYRSSSHSISDRLFEVRPDGVVLA